MGFGDFYAYLGKFRGNFRGKQAYHRVFRGKMPGVNEVQTQIVGIPELVVFHVRRDEGVASGTHRVLQLCRAQRKIMEARG